MHCIYKGLFLLAIVLVDCVVYEVLDLVAKYGHVDYHQEGELSADTCFNAGCRTKLSYYTIPVNLF
jgi:hypothetical protein